MLKNFKLAKRGSDTKGRITSADISTPTMVIDSNGDSTLKMKTVPVRYFSESAQPSENRTSSISKRLSSKSRQSSTANKDVTSSPEKIIKAIYKYHSQTPNELSFSKGDFFYVLNEEGEWFSVINPSTNKSGMVPKSYFEIIDKRSSSASGSIPLAVTPTDTKFGSLYAIVLYDFKAEKSDELTAYVGENLFICAHHNYEWFIAKPIGRLGGPGLVPMGFVSIIDIGTGYASGNDIVDDINSVNLPSVQEWKNNVAKYKASNITLGQISSDFDQNPTIYENGIDEASNYIPGGGLGPDIRDADDLNTDYLITASIKTFGFEDDKYWYSVDCEVSNGKARRLKRSYQDFYDLQVQLLDTFPAESGKLRDKSGQWTKRIMPYIPGPVPYVTDTITKKRMDDLDVYVKELIKLPEYISSSTLVNHLFQLRDNGYDQEYIPEEQDPLEAQHIQKKQRDISGPTNLSKRTLTSPDDRSRSDSNNRTAKDDDGTLTVDDVKMYDRFSKLSLSSSIPKSKPPGAVPPAIKPTKIKFYYKDDIFALLLNHDTNVKELRDKIAPRIESEDFRLFLKLADSDGEAIQSDLQVAQIIQAKMKISVHDA